jgi:predicted tellurium resistance membrane protein TerC
MDWVLPLITLTAMEIVLGIDNIVFIAILAGRLPKAQQPSARKLGLLAALGTRILLLLSITWVLRMDKPFVYLTDLGIPASLLHVDPANPKGIEVENGHKTVPDADHASMGVSINGISVKDLILLVGGLFLLWKSVHEIHDKIEGKEEETEVRVVSFWGVVAQIAVMDIIFSLDSVITAVGMVEADKVWVMILAIILAVGVMLKFSGAVSRFIDRNPTLKMLALSFLILIGVMLTAEGIGTHFNKGYIYFAMAFSFLVEMLNLRIRPKVEPAEDD